MSYWVFRRSYWAFRRSYWAFRRSYWAFRRSYWAFRRSYWAFRRSYWAFRRSYWAFRRSYWAFRRSYWAFRRSYWAFLWKIGRKLKEINERRRYRRFPATSTSKCTMEAPACAPLRFYLFFGCFRAGIFIFILLAFGLGCLAHIVFQLLKGIFLQFCRIGCLVEYLPRCQYFIELIKQIIQQS